jgi:uncharacterized protein (TIGR03435 family)
VGVLLAQQARPGFEVASVKRSFPEAHGGRIMHEFSNGRVSVEEVVGGKISMPSLAEFLTRHLRHPVMDETGYKGSFDIGVKFSSDEMWGRVSRDSDPSGFPTASGALRELGIKLELLKAPVEMLVIDSIDRPNPN